MWEVYILSLFQKCYILHNSIGAAIKAHTYMTHTKGLTYGLDSGCIAQTCISHCSCCNQHVNRILQKQSKLHNALPVLLHLVLNNH